MKPITLAILSLYCIGSAQAIYPSSAKAHPIACEADLDIKIKAAWSAISPIYLEHKLTHSHPGELVERPVFQDLIKKYATQAQSVLDAGTGNGWFATSLLQWDILTQLKRIIGIDLSESMIKNARSQCTDPRASFFCADLATAPYEAMGISKESFDLIISSNAFDCMQNAARVLQQLYRLLKPECCAIISIRHPQRNAYYLTGSADGLYKEGVYAERWNGTGEHDVIRFYRTESTWDKLFLSAGFEIVEKIVPVVSELLAQTNPEQYDYYKNKKHPGALVYVLKRS